MCSCYAFFFGGWPASILCALEEAPCVHVIEEGTYIVAVERK